MSIPVGLSWRRQLWARPHCPGRVRRSGWRGATRRLFNLFHTIHKKLLPFQSLPHYLKRFASENCSSKGCSSSPAAVIARCGELCKHAARSAAGKGTNRSRGRSFPAHGSSAAPRAPALPRRCQGTAAVSVSPAGAGGCGSRGSAPAFSLEMFALRC